MEGSFKFYAPPQKTTAWCALTDGGGDSAGEHVVDVADERVELWDELDQTLGQHNHAVVLAVLRALQDHRHQVVHNLMYVQQTLVIREWQLLN